MPTQAFQEICDFHRQVGNAFEDSGRAYAYHFGLLNNYLRSLRIDKSVKIDVQMDGRCETWFCTFSDGSRVRIVDVRQAHGICRIYAEY